MYVETDGEAPVEHSYSIGKSSSAECAEMGAISAAAQVGLEMVGRKEKKSNRQEAERLLILNDEPGAAAAMTQPAQDFHTITKQIPLVQLGGKSAVRLASVQGHARFRGNEIADALAKRASNANFQTVKLEAISHAAVKTAIKRETAEERRESFEKEARRGSLTARAYGDVGASGKEWEKLDRRTARDMHEMIVGKFDGAGCPLCNSSFSVEHLLEGCQAVEPDSHFYNMFMLLQAEEHGGGEAAGGPRSVKRNLCRGENGLHFGRFIEELEGKHKICQRLRQGLREGAHVMQDSETAPTP